MLPKPWNQKLKGLDHFLIRLEDRKKAKEPPPPKPPKPLKIKIKPWPKSVKLPEANFPWRVKPKGTGKTFDDGYCFRKALEKKGFVRLGGGNFSTVLGHPKSDRVIKITTNLTDNWLDYVVWGTQKGYAGTFTPKVFSYKKIAGREDEFAVAVMEKMEETLYRVDTRSDNAVVLGLFQLATDSKNLMAKCLLEEVSPGLGTFSEDLRKTFRRSLDLHGGNLMVRADGSVCITDPVANLSTLSNVRRLRTKDFITLPLPNVVAANDNEEQENCHDDYRSF